MVGTASADKSKLLHIPAGSRSALTMAWSRLPAASGFIPRLTTPARRLLAWPTNGVLWVCFASYLLTMDIILILRLQAMKAPDGSSNSSAASLPSEDSPREGSWMQMLLPELAVKGIFMDPLNEHIFMPLAKLTEQGLSLHSRAPWLSADLVSASHVVVAAVGMRFTAMWGSLGARRLGVLLFLVRFYLDALDGEVARARQHMTLSDPGFGSHGNLVDGICDLAGTVFQLLGMLVLLRAHKECDGLGTALALVGEWAGLLVVSSLGWNAAISRFHNILEPPAAPNPVARIEVMQSIWFWLVAWLWRILNPHAITASLLVAVYIDRHWEFAAWARRKIFAFVALAILLTEMELRTARAVLSLE